MSAIAEKSGIINWRELGGELGMPTRGRLRKIEADLLEIFSSNVGKPLSRAELYRQVWKGEFRGTTRTIDQMVATLRKKLSATQRILTVHRLGYSYVDSRTG